MDAATLAVIAISVFSGLFVLAFLLFRRFRGSIHIPGVGKLDVEGSKDRSAPPAGATIEQAESGGKAEARAEGGPASVRKTKAAGDIRAVSTRPREGDESKKA